MYFYTFFFMAVVYFHLYNICGFMTSSTHCMGNEITDSLMKTNQTFRDERLNLTDVNMTDYFEANADIYVFRVV